VAHKKLTALKTAESLPEPTGTILPEPHFTIVGIGASAGGLAAFEAFFSGMPADKDPDMAFVLVQHLAPDHKSILTDLIRRYTRMQVFEATDGVTVQPNCAYIIPPGYDMAVFKGTLQLLEPTAPRGQHLPIDFFFSSLAQDQQERAICIILSGTGSDGTKGARVIKGEGGVAIVQNPGSCEYDSMPRSVINSGLADYILPPAEMPAQIISYAAHAFGISHHPAEKKFKTGGVTSKALSAEEIDQLVHELQVHQIELEIQNEELRHTQHDLETVKNRYFNLYDLAPVAYLTLSGQGMIMEANINAATLFRTTRKELLNRPVTNFILPEDQGLYYLNRKQVIEGNESHGCELRMVRADGSNFWAYKHAMSAQGGEYLVTLTDITRIKQTEEELRRAKIEAEAATVAKSHFLANMSHEIRTPMNAIIGVIQLLEMADLPQEHREDLGMAKKAGLDLVRLINDILEFSKIEAHKIELEISRFDLRNEIADTIKLLSVQTREKGLELTCSIDPDVPTLLKGDAGRLRQIIINLVGNAIKFTPAGSVALQIRKDAEDTDTATIRFLVHDSGIGIAADEQGHIFEPFTQADSSTIRKYGGTGLGLTISKRFAELMGGHIGVQSIEGKGSTFWFTVMMDKQPG
jgi:PAS domain S-box-containing protein